MAIVQNILLLAHVEMFSFHTLKMVSHRWIDEQRKTKLNENNWLKLCRWNKMIFTWEIPFGFSAFVIPLYARIIEHKTKNVIIRQFHNGNIFTRLFHFIDTAFSVFTFYFTSFLCFAQTILIARIVIHQQFLFTPTKTSNELKEKVKIYYFFFNFATAACFFTYFLCRILHMKIKHRKQTSRQTHALTQVQSKNERKTNSTENKSKITWKREKMFSIAVNAAWYMWYTKNIMFPLETNQKASQHSISLCLAGGHFLYLEL